MNITNNYRRLYTQSRRGMILLVVMTVLALFAVMGMTFILITGKNRDSAEATLIATQSGKTAGNSPQELLEEGIMQVLVGPGMDGDSQSTNSALYHNDLIGDMYNYEGNVTSVSGTFANNKMTPASADYAGKVVTITDGQYKGQSTLILNSSGAILPFASGIGTTDSFTAQCVINSKRPYQGDGAAYDAADLNDTNNQFMSLRYSGGVDGCKAPVGRVILPSYYRGDNVRPGDIASTELGGTDVYDALSSNSITTAATGANKADSPWDVDNDGDGDNDSVWMNLGLPPRAMADGTLVVPMYAILVEDMDGRINVNAHGMKDSLTASTSYTALSGATSTTSLANGTTITNSFDGMGFGPAEINIKAVLGNVATNIIDNRGLNQDRVLLKQRYPEFYELYSKAYELGKGSKFYRSPLDFFGVMTGAVDQNGMFVWQQCRSMKTLNENPYELDLGYSQPRGDRVSALNTLYSPEELEAVLRIYDDDSKLLEAGLRDQVEGISNFNEVRNLITTESWDMPFCDLSKVTNQDSLPEEVRAGFKFDINRPLTSYENSSAKADTERTQLAQDLYNLIISTCPNVDKPRAAQWAVNAVDFRDADSVCTRLQVDGKWYFGCERPELLITETFAYHARMTEDSEVGGWRMPDKNDATSKSDQFNNYEYYSPDKCTDAETFCNSYPEFKPYLEKSREQIETLMKKVKESNNGVADLDQVYQPESGLYIQLYNPWTNAGINENVSSDIYSNNGVDLTKASNSPVWRIAIAETVEQNKKNGMTKSMPADIQGKKIERALYFGGTSDNSLATYSYTAATSVKIQPGHFAVIGPSGNSILSRSNTTGGQDTTNTRVISIESNKIVVDGKTLDSTSVSAIGVNPANGSTKFSITDTGKYASEAVDSSTGKLTQPRDTPFYAEDKTLWENIDGNNNGLGKDCIIPAYRTAYLQRLANPYLKYDQTSNPYITIDTCPIDLNCYNGRQTRFKDFKILTAGETPSESDEIGATLNSIPLKSRHRGETQLLASVSRNLWLAEEINKEKISTPSNWTGKFTSTNSGGFKSKSAMSKAFYQSFGMFDSKIFTSATNKVSVNGVSIQIPQYKEVPAYYFPNRPFNSVVELFLVPQVSAFELTTSEMAIDNKIDGSSIAKVDNLPLYLYPKNNSGINFLNGNSGANLFNFIRVQSPFTNTPMNVNTFNARYINIYSANFASSKTFKPFLGDSLYRWSFREPGKININSITSSSVWTALLGKENSTTTINGIDTNLFTNCWGKKFTNPTDSSTIFKDTTGNYVISNYQLFGMSSTATECQSAAQSPYFQTQLMQRLSNMTTTRSNVFAVWITVGFFEYNGTNDGTFHVGKEYGLDNGSRQRYRAFYLIDRTRPAGYAPGKRYNAEKTILLRRYLP